MDLFRLFKMNIFVIFILLHLLIRCDCQAQITPLDARPFLSQFRNFRDLALNLLGDIGDNGHKIKVNQNNSVGITNILSQKKG